MACLLYLSLFFQTGPYLCAGGMFCKIQQARSKAAELAPVWTILNILFGLRFQQLIKLQIMIIENIDISFEKKDIF